MRFIKYYSLVGILLFAIKVNAQWVNTGGPPISRSNQALEANGQNIFSGTNQGMVRSTTGGGNWINIDNGLTSINVNTVKYFTDFPDPSGSLFAGSGKVFWSTNNGDLWSVYPNDTTNVPANPSIYTILNRQNQIWIGTSKGVYYQQGSGTWTAVNSGFPFGENISVYSLINNGNDIFAGSDRGVFKLVDTSWVEKNNGLTNTFVNSLARSNNYLFAGGGISSSGIYISSDNGDNWNIIPNSPAATAILTIGPNVFAGSFGDGVWLSTNYGSSWNQINDGFSGSAYYVLSLAENGEYIYAGTNAASVWKRALSEIITAVNEKKNILPNYYNLSQNYPNPFNPSTTISFSIPQEEVVSLKIYNSLGQELESLIDKKKPAGSYSVSFDAGKLASGIYFYRISTGSYSQTRKMILVK
jgi:Secretion system C-terminal sorting domain